MNLLVIGRAKTGTTVLSKTVQNSLGGSSHYNLEPKNIQYFFNPANFPKTDHQITKIIYEHWNTTPRFRNGLIYNESPIKFDKVICIVRDPRDELISRLLYVIKPWMDAHGVSENQNARWLELLRRKEEHPAEFDFLELVSAFDSIYQTHMEKQILDPAPFAEYFSFVESHKNRIFSISYEDFMQNKLGSLEDHCKIKFGKSREVGELSRTKRSASYDNWRSFLNEGDVARLKPLYDDTIGPMGYKDWELTKLQSLPTTDYSGYVQRLIADQAVD